MTVDVEVGYFVADRKRNRVAGKTVDLWPGQRAGTRRRFRYVDRALLLCGDRLDEAVAFADASPFPEPTSLYDDVYVLGDQVQGWYSIDERSAGVHRGEDEG